MSKDPRKAKSQDKSLPGRAPTRPIRSSSRLEGQEPPVPTPSGSANVLTAGTPGQESVSVPPQKKARISSTSSSTTASPSTPPRMKTEESSSSSHQRKPTPTHLTASTASPSQSSSAAPHFPQTADLKNKGATSLWVFTQNVKLEPDTGASNLRQVDADVHSTLSQTSWSEPPPIHRIRAALQYLKYNALKPDPVVTGGLMRLCKAMPDLFREPVISTMMIQMLRPEFTHTFKIRTNGAVVFLVCALLHQAWDDVLDWPTDFVMAYLEDALGERSWCAHADTKSFVQNVQTAFLTDDSTADSAEGKIDTVRLDERANSSAIMAAIDLNEFTSMAEIQASSIRALIKQTTLQTIWDHVPAAIGASAVDATVRSLIKVMMATVRWTEVRLKAMGCMEFWLGNFTKNAKPLLRLILRQISQQDTLNSEDVKAWEMLLDFRYSGRAHQVEAVKDEMRVALVGLQGQELIRIGLQHIMAIELNPTEMKNPYHLDLMELLLQSIPGLALAYAVREELLRHSKIDNSAVEFGKLVQTRVVEAALHLNGLPENLTSVPVVHVVKRWIKYLGKRGSSWIIDMVVGLLEDKDLLVPLYQKQERVSRYQSSLPSATTPMVWLRLLTEILCYIMLSTAIDAREQDDIRASKVAVSQAQVFILEWLRMTFGPSDQASYCSAPFGLVPTEGLRACVARLLFLDPLMSYAIDTSTQEFDTTLIFKAIEGGLPIIEEGLVSLLRLSLPPHMSLGLVGEYVSRALEYSKVNSECLIIRDATVVDKIYELALFADSPDAKVVERAKAVPLAWTSSFWACSLICVMIACCNPRTLGLVVWDTIPVLRILLECSISQHYSFPPPNYTSTSDPSAESLVRRSMLLDQEDKAAVLQWDPDDSEYSGSLMVLNYRQPNCIRRPPSEVLNELRSLNERFGLGMKLASSRDPDYLGRMVGPNDDSAWVDKLLRDVPEILKALPASTLCARYCRTVEASSEMDINWGEDSVSASAAVSGVPSTDPELRKKLSGHIEAFMESVARYDSNSSVFADYLTRPQARYREVCDIFEFFLNRLALLAKQQQSNDQVLSGDPHQVKVAMLLLFQGDLQWPHVLLQVTTKISNPTLTNQVIQWLQAIMLQDDSIAWIVSCLQYLLHVDDSKTGQHGRSDVVEKSLQALAKVITQRKFVWLWLVQHRPNLVKILGKRLEKLVVNNEHWHQDSDIDMDTHDTSLFSAETMVVECADGRLLRVTPEVIRLILLFTVQAGQSQGVLYQQLCVGPARLQGGKALLYTQYPLEEDGDLRRELVKGAHDISIARIALEGMSPVQILDLARDLFGVDGAVAEAVMEALLKVLDENQQELPIHLDPETAKTLIILLNQLTKNHGYPTCARALEVLQSRFNCSRNDEDMSMDIENQSAQSATEIAVPTFFIHPRSSDY
ncbi:Integrator complex subunit 1 [Actinomortierella wolfii]|nr:Integrator complex subunit 1 [Actinomortierella wolfii]